MFRRAVGLGFVCAVMLSSLVGWGQGAPEIVVEHGVAMKTRDGVTLARRYISVRRAKGSIRCCCSGRLITRLMATSSGRGAARGFMVVVQDVRGRYTSEGEWYPFKHEIERWLRHGGVGGGAAEFEWQGGHVWGLVCGRDADAGGGGASAAPGGDLPGGDGEQLPRELDLPGWGVRAVVQRVVDLGAGAGHAESG